MSLCLAVAEDKRGQKEQSHFPFCPLSTTSPGHHIGEHVIVGSWGISDLIDSQLPEYIPLPSSGLCPIPEHDYWVT